MSWICKLFGHSNYLGDFYKIEPNDLDGIGRQHGTIVGRCERCDGRIYIGRTHIPEWTKESANYNPKIEDLEKAEKEYNRLKIILGDKNG